VDGLALLSDVTRLGHLREGRVGRRGADAQPFHPPGIGVGYLEFQARRMGDHLTALRNSAGERRRQPGGGVDIFLDLGRGKVLAQCGLEVFEGDPAIHFEHLAGPRQDLGGDRLVVLVVDLSNNRFDTSSRVTRPSTPPNSSMTIAM